MNKVASRNCIADSGSSTALDHGNMGVEQDRHRLHTARASPDRGNWRRRRPQGKKSKQQRGMSFYELLHGPGAEQKAFDWCVEVGLLTDLRDPHIRPYACPKCDTAAKWMTVLGRPGHALSYQCLRPCCYLESVTAAETDLFLPCVPLTKQVLVLYLLIHCKQPGIEKLLII